MKSQQHKTQQLKAPDCRPTTRQRQTVLHTDSLGGDMSPAIGPKAA